MRTIDHYSGPTARRTQRMHREELALDMIARATRTNPNAAVLDAGCGDATFLGFVGERFPGFQRHGVDFSVDRLGASEVNGVTLAQADLHVGLPQPDASFDLVYSGEVLEHLWDPDHFLHEARRVLRPGGHLVLSTPNLLAWYNRALAVAGVQPLFIELSTADSNVGVGPLRRFKAQDRPAGHVRIFTKDGLHDILELCGFEVLDIRGATFERFPLALQKFDRLVGLRANLASNLVALARVRA